MEGSGDERQEKPNRVSEGNSKCTPYHDSCSLLEPSSRSSKGSSPVSSSITHTKSPK